MKSLMALEHDKESLSFDQAPKSGSATRTTNKRSGFKPEKVRRGDAQQLSPEEQMAWFLDAPLGNASSGCCFE
jgi:hypothetical protein